MEFLTRRNFVFPLLISFALQFAYMGGFIISPLIMMGVFGLGQAATSMWTIARPISFSASSPVGGHLGSIYGERLMVISGSILIFVAMMAFAAGAAEESMALILVGLIFAGLGMGLAQPSLSTLVASAVSEHDHGIAVSTMSTTSGIGAVAGISILTALCADAESGSAFRDGYAPRSPGRCDRCRREFRTPRRRSRISNTRFGRIPRRRRPRVRRLVALAA